MNRTKQYGFESLSVGNYVVVTERFQHARVAASEYGRKNNAVFSCRMQDDGSMHVYRCDATQATVDVRGARGKRRIHYSNGPTRDQFNAWLTGLAACTVTMPATYAAQFDLMSAWCELYSLRSGVQVTAIRQGDTLLIKKS